MTNDPIQSASPLGFEDVVALDALINAGYDLALIANSSVDPQIAARAEHIARLMGIVDAPIQITNRALVDVTFLRAMKTPAGSAKPAEEHASLASLLTTGPAFDAAARERLIGRTLAGIDAALDEQADRMRLDARRAGRVASISIRDIVSVAAVLMIAASVVWPVLSHMRDESRRLACNTNLGATSSALASYAQDYQYSTPMVAGFSGGTPWWNVGSELSQSNSANLYTLSREGYVSLAALACPGNAHAQTVSSPDQRDWRSIQEISYSYQIQPAVQSSGRPGELFDGQVKTRPAIWGNSASVVMTDRSPVILRAIRGEPIDPWANSPNHDGRGQHVVLGDGSVGWLSTPEIGPASLGSSPARWSAAGSAQGDNIWLPRSLERAIDQATGRRRMDAMKGTELPESADDAFVGP